MTISRKEIKDLRSFYEKDLYGKVRSEQRADVSYYNDTFAVPEVKTPHRPLRSGLARKIVDNPAEQMITRNPKVYITCKNTETTNRVSKVLNLWVDILRRQNPILSRNRSRIPCCWGKPILI